MPENTPSEYVRQLLTVRQIDERYPVAVSDSQNEWRRNLKVWREENYLIEGKQWVIKRHMIRARGRPAYIYDEPSVLYLVKKNAEDNWFLQEVMTAHCAAIMSVLRGAVEHHKKGT